MLQTPIAWNLDRDTLWWPGAKTGEYSVKSGCFQDKKNDQRINRVPSSSYGVEANVWKRIWRQHVPQKVKVFLWKLCQNAIPVLGNLWKRKIVRFANCPICSLEPESIEHTFLVCEWTRNVWFGLQIQCLSERDIITTLHDWLEQKFSGFTGQGEYEVFASIYLCCALWSIWKEQNTVVFDKKNPNPVAAISRASILQNDYFSFWKKTPSGTKFPKPNWFCQYRVVFPS